jgi:hypothetical protein
MQVHLPRRKIRCRAEELQANVELAGMELEEPTLYQTKHSAAPKQRSYAWQAKGKVAEPEPKDDLAILVARQKERERRRNRSLHLKKVVPDVFIPSLVTVGNLARLLNIKIGELKGSSSLLCY